MISNQQQKKLEIMSSCKYDPEKTIEKLCEAARVVIICPCCNISTNDVTVSSTKDPRYLKVTLFFNLHNDKQWQQITAAITQSMAV